MDDANETRADFLEHLEELRFTLVRALIVLAFGVGIASAFARDLVNLLEHPFLKVLGEKDALIFTRPGEAFTMIVQVVLIAGAVIALPAVLWEVWGFVAPGLTRRERRYVLASLPGALALFFAGVAFCYLVLPVGLKVLHDIGVGINLTAYWSLGACVIFLLWTCLIFGLLFELPLVMAVLSLIGVVPPALFARGRKYAIFIVAVVVAVVTPTTDIFTMVMMSVPLVLLYEFGIFIARRVQRGT